MNCISVLEPRRLLAGNVTVTFSDQTGVIDVVGDQAGNAITIVYPGTIDARIKIVGRGGTTVNGQASAEFDELFSLRLRMNGGDDDVRMPDVYLLSRTGVDLGSGNDLFRSDGGRFTYLDVVGGAGNDSIGLSSVTARHALQILPGAGSDRTGLENVRARAGLNLSDEGSSARISLIGVFADGATYIGTSNGRDRMEIRNSGFDLFRLRTRGGDDIVTATNFTSSSSSPFDLGPGNDSLTQT